LVTDWHDFPPFGRPAPPKLFQEIFPIPPELWPAFRPIFQWTIWITVRARTGALASEDERSRTAQVERGSFSQHPISQWFTRCFSQKRPKLERSSSEILKLET
jgi:hypothetical protein